MKFTQRQTLTQQSKLKEMQPTQARLTVNGPALYIVGYPYAGWPSVAVTSEPTDTVWKHGDTYKEVRATSVHSVLVGDSWVVVSIK